ncbi:hypothetical protein [Arthrobacter zhaoguopingii]|uniref:hypothetical protein n=1 Tax=Arthrobacter zhaoguopingii TaxID=2681491 RepID=UPI001356DD3F|nr:hypothetical protein [Arthrobacter zhaoguopingii]
MSGFTPNCAVKGVRTAGQFAHATHAESASASVDIPPSSPSRSCPPQPSQHLPRPSPHRWPANACSPLRAAEQLTDMDRALAAYASRTVKSGIWQDYLPAHGDRLPSRGELLAAVRAFEEAPVRLANLPSVRTATDAIEQRKAEYFAQRRNHERAHGTLAGFPLPRPDITAEHAALAAAAPGILHPDVALSRSCRTREGGPSACDRGKGSCARSSYEPGRYADHRSQHH